MTTPVVSFAIASYNSSQFLEAAVATALGQRGVDVEVLIVDDQSIDGSWALAQRLAASDVRIRAWQLPENRGPGGARNFALDQAHGEWLAVLDSDDLMHPYRCERLIAEAIRAGADMIADDLLLFDEARRIAPSTFLKAVRARSASWIDLSGYLSETIIFGRHPNLGFLKPIIKIALLKQAQVRYDERLRIAEDDDLVLRLLLCGAKYWVIPRPLYFYRKHGGSISHRLAASDVRAMIAAADRLVPQLLLVPQNVQALFAKRRAALANALAFTYLIDAIHRCQPIRVAAVFVRNIGVLPLMRMPVVGAFAKLRRRTLPDRSRLAPTKHSRSLGVVFISRQRIEGALNGSSAYLLALAQAARSTCLIPHLVVPSPLIFGRTPFLRLRPELKVFSTIQIRGALQIGSWVFALSPNIYAAAAWGIVARLLRRVGVGGALSRDIKAPYAVAAPWTTQDLLYVTSAGRDLGRVALADYIFQAEAFPYLLEPPLRTGIVMHDLFSARTAQFNRDGAHDSVEQLSEADEIALLGRANAVFAIQAHEAEFVRRHVPGVTTILTPMAITPVDRAYSGDASRLLFVGSNTAPNVHGLLWFLENVWSSLRAQAPGTTLCVVGSVCSAIDHAPLGVQMCGRVDDLAPYYERSGIVISPLRQGSGLKIKLIEALQYGKAAVVTSTTLQGLEDLLAACVIRADTAQEFIDAIINLQISSEKRSTLGKAALQAARDHFSPEAAYRHFRAWLLEVSSVATAPGSSNIEVK